MVVRLNGGAHRKKTYFTCKIVVFIDLKPVVAMTTDNVSPLVSPGSQTKKKQKKKKKSVNEIVLEDDLHDHRYNQLFID
jgi:hypothetical protein